MKAQEINEEVSFDIDSAVMRRGEKIELWESRIIEDQHVYLITWSPDPGLLPDADFETQHNYNVNFLAGFLYSCRCGLLCVESTQMGNPHYHGWYQVSQSPELELWRISYIKTMQKHGIVKITPCRHVKPGLWSERRNGLYYYKKDLLDTMLTIKNNPIDQDSKDDTDWNVCLFFFTKEIKDKRLDKKLTDRAYYLQFYRDSNE